MGGGWGVRGWGLGFGGLGGLGAWSLGLLSVSLGLRGPKNGLSWFRIRKSEALGFVGSIPWYKE